MSPLAASRFAGGGSGLVRIAEQVIAGAAVAQIDFLAIPQTYRNLLLLHRLNGDGVNTQVRARFNADAAANYDTVVWTAAAAGAPFGVMLAGDTAVFAGEANGGAGSDPQSFGFGELWIPNYAHAAMRKTTLCRGVRHDSTTVTQSFMHGGGTWRGEVPITELRLFLVAGNIEAESVATLYGLS